MMPWKWNNLLNNNLSEIMQSKLKLITSLQFLNKFDLNNKLELCLNFETQWQDSFKENGKRDYVCLPQPNK